MDWAFSAITVMVAFIALGQWRGALYACIVLDLIRDYVRKTTPGNPILPTVIVGIVWAMALLGASSRDSRELSRFYSRYPRVRSALMAIVVAILPAALISLVRYQNGWILAAIGGISYLAPLISVFLGYLWPRTSSDVIRWIAAYATLNSLMLIGTILEAAGADIPGLGGMNMDWVRYSGTDTVKLVCGFFRSPDVMGLHAAFVLMFASTLALNPTSRFSWVWWGVATWSASCLLVCGRRKMIAMPVVFLGTYVLLNWWSGKRGRRSALVAGFFGVFVIIGMAVLTQFQETSDDYSRYASSVFVEGIERVSKSFWGIAIGTIQQSGILGDGLGSATQGKQHTGITIKKSWQEDGVGRLLKELGIPGTALIAYAGFLLLKALSDAFKSLPNSAIQARHLQFSMAGFVAANGASFIVSHQAYSGDPSTVLIVGFGLGMVFGMPRIWFGEQTPIRGS